MEIPIIGFDCEWVNLNGDHADAPIGTEKNVKVFSIQFCDDSYVNIVTIIRNVKLTQFLIKMKLDRNLVKVQRASSH